MIDKAKSLACLYPELAKEWHPTKNGELLPTDVLPGSNKKVWWLGKCGHEWDAVIASRIKGIGCPICANRRALKGFNDLATTHPELAVEWHPTKNGNLHPDMTISANNQKVWWIDSFGHEWQQTISNRKNGQGCPICKNRIISEKIKKIHMDNSGSLALKYPELAKEWHPTKNGNISPDDVTAGDDKIVWWIGKCCHEWKASINNRVKGTNCPYCSNQRVFQGFNDLATLFPSITLEWHPTKNGDKMPSDVLAKSNKKYWWLGKCGHEWIQSVSHRATRGQGCPVCAKRLQTSFPEQAVFYYIKKVFPDAINSYKEAFENEMELDIYIPSIKLGIEYDGAAWHNTGDSINREAEKYKICRDSGIRLIRIKESADDRLLHFCDELIPAQRHGTKEEINNVIQNLFTRLDAIGDIDVGRDEQIIRSQYYTGSSTMSFAYAFPKLLDEWNYEKNESLDPYSLSISSGVTVWWKCKSCGYEWKSRIAERTQGHGCKKCGFIKRSNSQIANRIKEKGSLFDNNPELAKEWHPAKNKQLLPSDVLAGSTKKVWWKCSKCGNEWQEAIAYRNKGWMCPKCRSEMRSSNRVNYYLKKNGSLLDCNPILASEWDYNKNVLLPDQVSPRSHKKAYWLCSHGHSWYAEIKSRNSGSGCPYCKDVEK